MKHARKKQKQLPELDVKALESTLLSPADFDDLRWLLLEDFRGDLGVRSNQGDLYDQLVRSCPSSGPKKPSSESWHVIPMRETRSRKPQPLDEATLRAATRLRRLEGRWALLAIEHQNVLRIAYGRTKEAVPGWGELGAVALLSVHAEREYHRAKAGNGKLRWLAGLRGRGGEAAETYFALQADARTILRPACDAWARTFRQRTGT